MTVILPQPRFEHVPIDYSNIPWWKQLWKQLTLQSNPPRYRLIEDWYFTLPNNTRIVIPKDFITDFASIPRAIWSLIAPDGPLYLGAIIHDFAYQNDFLLAPTERGRTTKIYEGNGQDFFDRLLRDITIATSGATVEAEEAYVALSMFGHIAWDNYRKSDKN